MSKMLPLTLVWVTLTCSAALADARVLVLMVNNEKLEGKLLQYVGGGLVIEQANGQRLAIDVRWVKGVFFTDNVSSDMVRRWGEGRTRPKFQNATARGGDSELQNLLHRRKRGSGSTQSPTSSEAAAPQRQAKAGEMDQMLETKLEALAELSIDDFGRVVLAQHLIESIAKYAGKSGQTELAHAWLADQASKADGDAAERTKWLSFAAAAYAETGDWGAYRRLREQAYRAAGDGHKANAILRRFFDKWSRRPEGRHEK